MHDLVIRNGRIIDGTGGPEQEGDVAIDGGRITSVGGKAGAAEQEIDAEGHLVTPGWVDIHTHYDGQVTWDPHLTPSGWNGVTTVVMGNCGVGFAPAKPDRRNWLIELMEGVEDIPGAALAEGIDWQWETFPEYLDALEKLPRSLDVAAQVPHGAVRAYVMDERGAKNEQATEADIAAMAEIVREGLRAGAVGFSSSRTLLHRAKDGEPVPGTFAGEDELLGIGSALGDVGHGVFEVASDLVDEGKEVAWMRKLSQVTGQPVTFACLQNDFNPDQWRRLLTACEEAAAENGKVVPQVAQRPAGLLLSLESTIHPLSMHARFAELATLPLAERVARMRDPEVRAKIIDEKLNLAELPDMVQLIILAYQKMFPLGDPPDYEPGPEKSVQSMAAARGCSPTEVIYDCLLENEGRGILYYPLLGYSNGDLEAIREMMIHPQSVFGLSDGGAHCGIICDASMPTFLLSHWARDRTRGEKLPLEYIVHCQTRRTAELFGFRDRGCLQPGLKADVNVIDFGKVRLHPPEMIYDLPGQSRRLVQHVDGYRNTICAGEVTYAEGEPTGAMPGRLLRGPQG